MKFENSLALFQHLLNIDEDKMLGNLPSFIQENDPLYNEVNSLIDAHYKNKENTEFKALIGEQAESLVEDESIHTLAGTQVGVYKLTEKLGQGGMGAVYLGERNDGQLEQKVAIKFVYPSIAAIAGEDFLNKEAQHLANLDHANIAKIFTVAKTKQGLPYMVMEFVDGLPIDQYCELNGLNLKERLKLFQKVCSAVQTAHQNMVVHADLKPSNILVDKQGEPKLMDFGIARNINLAMDGDTFDEQQNKDYLKALSRDYASPEQLAGEGLTSSSDVYSLGCVLNAIQLDENKELSAIINKACKIEKNNRYHSASELLNDVKSLCSTRPVTAYSQSNLYYSYKFSRRNFFPLLLFIGLLVSIISSSIVIFEKNRDLSFELSNSNQLSDFLIQIFDSADTSSTNTLTAKELLDSALLKIENSINNSPITQFKLKAAMAQAYQGLAEYEIAETLFLQAIENNDVNKQQKVATINRLGFFYIRSGDLKQSKLYLDEVSNTENLPKEVYMENQFFLGMYMHETGALDKALGYYREALKLYQNAPKLDLYMLSNILNNLGYLYSEMEQFENSIDAINQSLNASEQLNMANTPSYAATLVNLGAIYTKLKEYEKSTAHLERAQEIFISSTSVENPKLSYVYHNIGVNYKNQNNDELALTYFEKSLASDLLHYHENHATFIATYNNLAQVYRRSKAYEKAVSFHKKALGVINFNNVGGVNSSLVATAYAETLYEMEQYQAAKLQIENALGILNETAPNHSVMPRVKELYTKIMASNLIQ